MYTLNAERHDWGVRNDGDGDGQEMQERHECDDDGSDNAQLLGGGVCMFRCPLKRAMRIVVSTDPERAVRRREWNEMLEEMLGEE